MTDPSRITLVAHLTVTVKGTDDKPAIEFTASDDEIKIMLLPKNGQRRAPVKLDDLVAAVKALSGDTR